MRSLQHMVSGVQVLPLSQIRDNLLCHLFKLFMVSGVSLTVGREYPV